MFYSASTGGFYSHEIHGANIPADAVEITDEEHAALLDGQSNGKLIDFDEDGYPFLTDPPGPTPEQLQELVNTEARAYLAGTDWYVIRLQETGEVIPPAVLEARASARASVVNIPAEV